MTTLLLVRHGRTDANVKGILAGWTPGVTLDETGVEQASALGQRLAGITLAGIVASPLERTMQTATHIASHHESLRVRPDERLAEVRYGEWTGRELSTLTEEPLWRQVQAHPSSVTFPGEGESMAAMATRAVQSVRFWNAEFGADATWVAVSHGDVIKAIVADALGLHLDHFQRIHVDPCSVTIIKYHELRPLVVRLNDTAGGFEGIESTKPALGGGAGPSAKH